MPGCRSAAGRRQRWRGSPPSHHQKSGKGTRKEDPAESVGTDWRELLTVLGEPEKLPQEVKERIERAGQGLGKVLMKARFACQGERSTADYHLCCICARFGFPSTMRH